MVEIQALSIEQLLALRPLAVTIIAVLIIMMLALWQSKWPSLLVALSASAFVVIDSLSGAGTVSVFGLQFDVLSRIVSALTGFAAFVTFLVSFRYLDQKKEQHPEYQILLLLSLAGMQLMNAAADLMLLFIGIELMSLSIYVLVAFARSRRACCEAAIKYFLLGSVASAFFLYGMSFIFGATGSLAFTALAKANGYLGYLGIGLLTVGFLFKMGAPPFQMWVPDVYEGAMVPLTGFMASAVKAASVFAFVRVLTSCTMPDYFWDLIRFAAIAAIFLGNAVALTQTRLKRFFAYSSIAHTGYMLLGILGGSSSAIIVYLVVYSVASLGVFSILTLMSGPDDSLLTSLESAGFGRRHPVLGGLMSLFVLSLSGMPPLAGFFGKYQLFVFLQDRTLVLFAMLASTLGLAAYVRLLINFYMKEPIGVMSRVRTPVGAFFALSLVLGLMLHMSFFPDALIRLISGL